MDIREEQARRQKEAMDIQSRNAPPIPYDSSVYDKTGKLKVAYICGDSAGPAWHEIAVPTKYMNETGKVYAEMFFGNFELTKLYDFNIVVLQRQNSPTAKQIIGMLKDRGIKTVYHFTDNFWEIPPSNPAKSYYTDETLRRMEGIMGACDMITVTTDPLVEKAIQFNDRVEKPWEVVETDVFDGYRIKEPRIDDEIRILWVLTVHHEDDVYLVSNSLGQIARKYPNTKFIFFGYFNEALQNAIPLDQLEVYGGVPVWEYTKAAACLDGDIGIAPVIAHPFNRSKCLIGNTRICTNNGVNKISDITKDMLVYNGNEYVKPIELFKYNKQEVKTIITQRGYKLTGTFNHKIKDDDNEWKCLNDLEIGDYVKLTPLIFSEKEVEIKFPLLKTQRNEFISQTSLPIIRIDENWGRLLGYIIGDGHLSNSNRFSITCFAEDLDVVEDVQNKWNSIGISTSIRKKIDYHTRKDSNAYTIDGFSRQFTEFAKYIGILGKRKILRIPDCIWQSPKYVIKEFLMGLFESDGTISINGPISITSKDKSLIDDIQIILLGFGIISNQRSQYNKIYNRHYYTLILNREACDIFYKEIGFISKRKSDILKERINKPHSNAFKLWEWKDEITDIQFGIEDVYDLELSEHQYIANGFVSHNSRRKWFEYSAIGTAMLCSDYETYSEERNMFHMENCYKVKKNKAYKWTQGLEYLIENPDERKRIAKNAWDYVHENHNAKNHIHKWVDMYRRLVED